MKIKKIKNNINEIMGWDVNEGEILEVVLGVKNGVYSGVVGIVYVNGSYGVVGLRRDKMVENEEEMLKCIEEGF